MIEGLPGGGAGQHAYSLDGREAALVRVDRRERLDCAIGSSLA